MSFSSLAYQRRRDAIGVLAEYKYASHTNGAYPQHVFAYTTTVSVASSAFRADARRFIDEAHQNGYRVARCVISRNGDVIELSFYTTRA